MGNQTFDVSPASKGSKVQKETFVLCCAYICAVCKSSQTGVTSEVRYDSVAYVPSSPLPPPVSPHPLTLPLRPAHSPFLHLAPRPTLPSPAHLPGPSSQRRTSGRSLRCLRGPHEGPTKSKGSVRSLEAGCVLGGVQRQRGLADSKCAIL